MLSINMEVKFVCYRVERIYVMHPLLAGIQSDREERGKK